MLLAMHSSSTLIPLVQVKLEPLQRKDSNERADMLEGAPTEDEDEEVHSPPGPHLRHDLQLAAGQHS